MLSCNYSHYEYSSLIMVEWMCILKHFLTDTPQGLIICHSREKDSYIFTRAVLSFFARA